MKRIYANLETRLNQEIEALSTIKSLQNESVDFSAADLSVADAELWTGHPIRMLTSVPLGNKVAFSFETPKDSSFVAGDSIVFSFKVVFVPEEHADVKQEAHAAITLNYNDGSYVVSGLSIDEPGCYDITVARNFKSRISSMSGYIHYFDNDESASSMVVLDALSLKRLHPVK